VLHFAPRVRKGVFGSTVSPCCAVVPALVCCHTVVLFNARVLAEHRGTGMRWSATAKDCCVVSWWVITALASFEAHRRARHLCFTSIEGTRT
jgi:hypothetical protein